MYKNVNCNAHTRNVWSMQFVKISLVLISSFCMDATHQWKGSLIDDMINSKVKARSKGKSSLTVSGCFLVMACVCVMVVVGIIVTVSMAPSTESTGPSTNSSLFVSKMLLKSQKLSEKIRGWMPHLHDESASTEEDASTLPPPPWEQEFWTPIDIMSVDSSPMVILCKLNFKEY